MSIPLRALIVEDSEDDAELLVLELRRGGYAVSHERVETADALRRALAGREWDVVFSDYTMPQFGAGAALELLRASGLDLPFLVVSGTVGEEAAVAAMRNGVNDYLVKGNLARLLPAVERELREAASRRARHAAEQAAARLAAIVQSSQDAIVGTDLAGVITSWNPAAERLFGWTAAEAVGRAVPDLAPPERTGESRGVLDALAGGGAGEHYETVRLRKDGTRADVAVSVSPVRDAAGRVVGASAIVRDVTEKKRVAEELRRSEERYRLLFDANPLPMWAYDAETLAFLAVNNAAVEHYGYDREEFLGMTIREIRPLEDVPALEQNLAASARAGGRQKSGPWRHRRRDGSVIHVEIFSHPVDFGGRPARLVLAHDVTQRRAAEEALARDALILAGVRDSVVVTDLAGVVTYWNEGATRLFGWTAAERLGRPLTDGFPESERARVAGQIRLGAAGAEWCGEYEDFRKDGSRVWIDARVSRIDDLAGRPVGVLGLSHDVTERKEAEREREKFTTLIEHSPDFIGYTDGDQRLRYLNRAGQCLVGLGGDAAVRQTTITDCVAEADLLRLRDEVLPTLLERRRWRGELLFRHFGGGEPVPVLCDAFMVPDGRTGAPAFFACIARDLREARQAEHALRESEQRYRGLFENAADAVYTLDLRGRFTSANAAAERLTGYGVAELLAMNVADLLPPGELQRSVGMFEAKLNGAERTVYELDLRARDGSTRRVEVTSRVFTRHGRPEGVQGFARDLTERRRLEEHLRQSQKMESVGRLAGGVAHDFNNLLTVINGCSDLLQGTLPEYSPARDLVAEIRKAGERAAGLTRQLLAFSRKQVLAPKVLDLNALVKDLGKMLRHLIGEDVELVARLGDAGPVFADPGQLEQVVVNLAVNARDAMPEGGTLTLETRAAGPAESGRLAQRGLRPGRYALLAVSDTGCGMSDEVKARVFEPFFTTKPVGQGTGLGLAVAHGVVQQSEGHIEVDSVPGRGTTFRVYLPCPAEAARPEPPAHGTAELPRGSGTVLLVEDEGAVRALARIVLQQAGYRVLEAADGRQALDLAGRLTEPLDLLLTDVVMPGLGGRQLAERLRAARPGLRVLFLSGYTEDAVVRQGVSHDTLNFLQKPFTPVALARKVREALEAPEPDQGEVTNHKQPITNSK